jgi:hypothetical protein
MAASANAPPSLMGRLRRFDLREDRQIAAVVVGGVNPTLNGGENSLTWERTSPLPCLSISPLRDVKGPLRQAPLALDPATGLFVKQRQATNMLKKARRRLVSDFTRQWRCRVSAPDIGRTRARCADRQPVSSEQACRMRMSSIMRCRSGLPSRSHTMAKCLLR